MSFLLNVYQQETKKEKEKERKKRKKGLIPSIS